MLVALEVVMNWMKDRHPLFSVPTLAYLLSEGISVCVIFIYGIALIFNKPLAVAIADKNGKILAVAMFMAFVMLAVHVVGRWFGDDDKE